MVIETAEATRAKKWEALSPLAAREVLIPSGEAKVDGIQSVPLFADSQNKIFGFDVPMDNPLGMDELDPGDSLIGQEKDGFERESLVAIFE